MKNSRFALIFTIIIMCNSAVFSVFAADDLLGRETLEQLNIIDANSFEDSETITRFECIVAIMKAIGATEKTIEYRLIIEFGADWWMPFLPPGAYEWDSDDEEKLYYYEKYYNAEMRYTMNYFELALMTGIVHGKIIDGEKCFDGDNIVTTKEALAFITRCLKPTDINNSNLDETFKRSVDLGIIKESDAFYKNSDNPIKPDELIVLLQRFLPQKRWIYLPEEIEDFDFYFKDKEESMTYLEYLQGR